MTLYKSDVVQYISRLKGEKFDIIFADPPYIETNFNLIVEKIQNCLKPRGIFCMEMKKQEIDGSPIRIKYYGNTQVVFWKFKT